MRYLWVIMLSVFATSAVAEDHALEYYKKAEALSEFRRSRQVGINEAEKMLGDKNTILLDTRGDDDFKKIHIRGARHLSYADFTSDRLAKLLPDKNSRIIIYCDAAIMTPLTRMMPLSTNAFVDLHMQDYKNLYEIRSISDIQPYQEQCKAIMDTPFEGDAAVIAEKKEAAMHCLSMR